MSTTLREVESCHDSAGLGLCIVRSIAEAHDGTFACESPAGGGPRFCLRLPLDG